MWVAFAAQRSILQGCGGAVASQHFAVPRGVAHTPVACCTCHGSSWCDRAPHCRPTACATPPAPWPAACSWLRCWLDASKAFSHPQHTLDPIVRESRSKLCRVSDNLKLSLQWPRRGHAIATRG
jgi:hypothetical protein